MTEIHSLWAGSPDGHGLLEAELPVSDADPEYFRSDDRSWLQHEGDDEAGEVVLVDCLPQKFLQRVGLDDFLHGVELGQQNAIIGPNSTRGHLHVRGPGRQPGLLNRGIYDSTGKRGHF